MKNVLDFMSKDHDRLDSIFQEFRNVKLTDPERSRMLFHDFRSGLQKHIVWEEEILFPEFEKKTGMLDTGPTVIMRMEHRKIERFLEKIESGIEKGETEQIDGLEKGLLNVLGPHNDKEESILYPLIDESLHENERADVFRRMEGLSIER